MLADWFILHTIVPEFSLLPLLATFAWHCAYFYLSICSSSNTFSPSFAELEFPQNLALSRARGLGSRDSEPEPSLSLPRFIKEHVKG